MDQERGSRDKMMPAAQTNPPVTLSDAQFARLIETVQQHRQVLVNSLHALNDDQQKASDLFDLMAMGIGVTRFGAPLPHLIRRDNTIRLPVPDRAVRARVYSETRVVDVRMDDCHELLDLTDCVPPIERVGRVEFYDARDELLEVTGGEPAPEPAPKPVRSIARR